MLPDTADARESKTLRAPLQPHRPPPQGHRAWGPYPYFKALRGFAQDPDSPFSLLSLSELSLSNVDGTASALRAPTADEARRAQRAAAEAAGLALYTLLCQRFSQTRMDAFKDSTRKVNDSATWIVARYRYSIAVSQALVPALHLLEVTLRNAIYGVVKDHVSGCHGVDIADCWLDWSEADTILNHDPKRTVHSQFLRVQAAKRSIQVDGRKLDAGRLIAELNFGFWTGLFAGHYGQRDGVTDPKKLWPDLLPKVFPNLPTTHSTRTILADHFKDIRRLRNRAFHHEVLWRRRPLVDEGLIIKTIGWMDAEVAALASEMSTAKEIQERGVGHYESMVRRFVLTRPGLQSGPAAALLAVSG